MRIPSLRLTLVSFLALLGGLPTAPDARAAEIQPLSRIQPPVEEPTERLRLRVQAAAGDFTLTVSGPVSSDRVAILQAPSLAELRDHPVVHSTRPFSAGSTQITLPRSDALGTANFFQARWESPVTNPHPESLVWVPPGTFIQGSPSTETGRDSDESPTVQVSFPTGFFVGRLEVTQADYASVMSTNPSSLHGDSLPVHNVSWAEAVAFCEQWNQREKASGLLPEGYAYRLPTEAEWEYAARAGTTTRFSHGDDADLEQLREYAWYADNATQLPQPAGVKRANPWGLQDVHGNVAEWCNDYYATYLGGRETRPQGPAMGEFHVFRGGSFADDPEALRSAFRDFDWLDERSPTVGFRLVLVPLVSALAIEPIELVEIPAGTFLLGSPASEAGHQFDEEPRMEVALTRAFYLSRYEITQAQYASLVSTNPSRFNTGQMNRPVENVSWNEAVEFCRLLTQHEREAGVLPAGFAFRLPTEAEWEYAARGGTTNRYYFGDDPDGDQLPLYAWSFTSGQTFNVGGRTPNPFGLFDVYGNVAEWCQDFADLYPGGPVHDPQGPLDSAYRILRGGSYLDDPQYLRSACRWSEEEPDAKFPIVGFRVALAREAAEPEPLPELVRLEPGTFVMGSPAGEPGRSLDEGPTHTVTLTRPYWIGKYEVTQAQYADLVGQQPSFAPGPLNRPVERVSWEEARAFCRALNQRAAEANPLPEGYEYRLPTEAEWEYAARAGTQTPYSFGDDSPQTPLTDYARFLAGPTGGVGSRAANPWGLRDMHGNVREWCQDTYGDYSADDQTDPMASGAGTMKVARGGSWDDTATECRSASRVGVAAETRHPAMGFRVVLGPKQP